MNSGKSPGIILSEITLLRNTSNSPLVLVEGESDIKFLKPRLPRSLSGLVICEGKKNLLGALSLANSRSLPSVYGVCDDDIDSLTDPPHCMANLVVTSTRDIEGFLVQSSALERVLIEYASVSAIVELDDRGVKPREILVSACLPLGRLRLVDRIHSLGIDFTQLRIARYLDSKCIFDEARMLADATKHVNQPTDLQALYDSAPNVDPWKLCRGHDLVHALHVALKRGSVFNGKNPALPDVEALLRQGLPEPEWLASSVYRDLRALVPSCF